MKRKLHIGTLLGGLLIAGTATALDATDRHFIDELAKGGPSTVRSVGETLFESHATNTEVLDVAAEVLLQGYPRASLDFSTSDAMAWLCKALGGSGNSRYRAAVDEVASKADNSRLRGHCKSAAKALPDTATASYVLGTVNLKNLRDRPQGSASDGPAAKRKSAGGKTAAATDHKDSVKKVDFSLVRVGMSAQELTGVLGEPTATTTHMTGKAFIPFNFGARDVQRMLYLYKGVGRIELSLKSAYEGVFRVVTITPNPDETGYP